MNEINKSPDLEMVVLQEISSAIVNERNGTALLRHILDVLYRRMKMLRGTFTIRRGNDLMIEASHGLDEQEMKRGHYHVGEGITGHVAETGRPHVIEDISRDSRFLNRTRTRKSGEKVAFICVPIIHLQQVIGTLSIDRPVDRETDLERDQKLLEIVGNIVGDALAASLQAHEERAALMAENEKLRQLLTTNPGELIGNCRPMLQVYEQIRQVAPSDATVLIRGSSGTGKELVARAVVNLSGRKDKPLVTLSFSADGPQRYRVNLLEGGEEREVTLEGDLWQLDARLLGWKGLAALIGLQPGYRLEKLSGRFLAIEQQQSARFARVALAESPYGIDLWRWLRLGQRDLFLFEPQAARVTYLPIADGAVFSVSLGPTGLMAQPMNQVAQQALKDW